MEEGSTLQTRITIVDEPHRKAAQFVCSLLRLTSQGIKLDWSWPDEVHVSVTTAALGAREALLLAEAVGQARPDECELEGTVLRLWWD